jgi:large subunit ribosomal protein L17
MRRTNARKFHRVRKVRNALLRSLAFSLIEKGKIKTTEAKAKEIRPVVEKFVSEAKKGTLGSRRILSAKLPQVATETPSSVIANIIASANFRASFIGLSLE